MSAFLTSLYFFGMSMTVAIDCDGTQDRQRRPGLVMSRQPQAEARRQLSADATGGTPNRRARVEALRQALALDL